MVYLSIIYTLDYADLNNALCLKFSFLIPRPPSEVLIDLLLSGQHCDYVHTYWQYTAHAWSGRDRSRLEFRLEPTLAC